MTISKNPLLAIEPCPDEYDEEVFLIALGELVAKRFKTGYVKCSAENLGWRHLSGYKVFECVTENRNPYTLGIEFLRNFMPECDWCATVYSLNNGKGLYFNVSHHDSMGESYYLTPISERTYDRLS